MKGFYAPVTLNHYKQHAGNTEACILEPWATDRKKKSKNEIPRHDSYDSSWDGVGTFTEGLPASPVTHPKTQHAYQ